MAYWWGADPNERYWVEIRKQPRIGTSLECPDHQINNDGTDGRNAWYELVHSVSKGDIVYHYNEREQRFVGRSVAASDAKHITGDQAYVVDLEDFTPIAASVDLAYMRERSGTLYRLRQQLRADHPDDTLYTPFQFRSSGLYGMMSNYFDFAKLPRDVVRELFGPDGLAEAALPIAYNAQQAADDGDVDPGTSLGSFLHPFKPKADSEYLSRIVGGRQKRSRRHERLINDCAAWLAAHGYEPMRNAAVDLGLEDPAVIIEGKTIGASWAPPVRQAVGQLYEYRYFKVASPDSALIFLSENAVPRPWVRYLEKDRGIGLMWPSKNNYHLSAEARTALKL